MGRMLLARWQMRIASPTTDEAGSSMVEYAMMGVFLAIVAAVTVTLVGSDTGDRLTEYLEVVQEAAGP